MPARAQSPSAPQAMIVTAVETTAIRVPLARTYRGNQYQTTHRSTTICRIHTDTGIFGEAWGNEDASLGEIQAIIEQEIAPLLIEEDAYAVERTCPANRAQLRDGSLQLSEQPGLGWKLDEDFIDRYRASFA
jgi:L-alanine-DL-glutamate epimerase-like enolase superfamily enzyme